MMFFDERGRLVSLVEATDRENESRRIVRRLMAVNHELTLRDHVAACCEPNARVSRAAAILLEVIRRERIGDWRGVERLWHLCVNEWKRLVSLKWFDTWLKTLAASEGSTEPVTLAAGIVSAIQEELLPGTLVLCELVAIDSVPVEHRRWLTKQLLQLCPTGMAPGPMLHTALDRQVLSARNHEEPLDRATGLLDIARVVSNVTDRRRIIEEFASHMATWISAPDSPLESSLRRGLDQLSEAQRQMPTSLAICQLRARVLVRLAIAAIERNAHLRAAYLMAEARLIDPSNGDAAGLAQAALEGLTSLRDRLLEMSRKPSVALNLEGQRLLQEAKDALDVLSSFAQTSIGAAATGAFHLALAGDLAYRLGMDPSDPHSQAAALAIAELARQAMPQPEHQRYLEENFPVTQCVPWDRVVAALTPPKPRDPVQFLYRLPGPTTWVIDEEYIATVSDFWHEVALPCRTRRRKLDVTLLAAWGLSSADKLAKSAAAAGLILCVAGGAVGARKSWDSRVRDRAYQDLTAALDRNAAAASRAAAREFLGHARVQGVDDRLEEVIHAYQRTLFKEVVSAKTPQQRSLVLDEARALEAFLSTQELQQVKGSAR